MLSMWEHIHRLNMRNFVLYIKQLEVPCLGSRITTYIYNTFRIGEQYSINYILMHTCAWRVCYYDIGTAMLFYKLLVQDILHITSIESCVVDIIEA